MRQTTGTRGNAMVAVLLILAIGGVVFYFASAPFSTRVNEAKRQVTEWTPENIQKDPVGYLQWAQGSVNGMEQQLQARGLGLRTKRNRIERLRVQAEGRRTVSESLLRTAKEGYRSAEQGGRDWPVEIKGVPFEKQALKEKIVGLHERAQGAGRSLDVYRESLTSLKKATREVDRRLVDARNLSVELSTQLEQARVRRVVEGLDAVPGRLEALNDTLMAMREMDGLAMEAEETTLSIDQVFSKIMADGSEG